jgi:hypothetical protein
MRARLGELMEAEASSGPAVETGYTPEEEALLEARLRELGYLD